VDFYSAYAQGFARVAACTLPVHLADPAANAATVIEQAQACHDDHVAVAVFPELCLTGYSVDDLFLQDALLAGVEEAIAEVVEASGDLMTMLVVGAPLVQGNRVYNCAVVIHRGSILGVAPKSYLPNYREFYERRWFAPGDDRELQWVNVAGQDVRFGPDLIFRCLDVPASTSTSRSARTCGCRCHRAPRPRSPARPCSPTSAARRSPSPARRTAGCWSAAPARAARRRTSMPRPGRASRPPT
jgi:hypothetical protein